MGKYLSKKYNYFEWNSCKPHTNITLHFTHWLRLFIFMVTNNAMAKDLFLIQFIHYSTFCVYIINWRGKKKFINF